MLGHAEVQASLSDKSTPKWHKSPSLSSATTTDEDFLTGSPKQRWADLSEEDDDHLSWERSPFGLLQSEVKDRALNSAVECAGETKMPHAGNEAHIYRGEKAQGSPQFFGSGQLDPAWGRYDHQERPTAKKAGSLREGAQPFTMLPPSFDRRGVRDQAALVAPMTQRDAPVNAARRETFTVTLCGIPPKLCNDACLDAILWASGVQRSALEYHTKRTGSVVVNFCTSEAATNCYNHFKSCSWATGKLQVDLVLPSSPHVKSGNGLHKADALSSPSNRRIGKHSRSTLAQPMW